jgi:hypothetical protein
MLALAGVAQTRQATVDYAKQIQPLLKRSCYPCHGNGTKLGGLQLDNRAAMLKGGTSGPALVPGSGAKSLLIDLVSGHQPNRIMPARGKRLTLDEIKLLARWIDEGAKFNTSGAATWVAPLAPRRPKVPAPKSSSGLTNPVDLLLEPYFAKHSLLNSRPVAERRNARMPERPSSSSRASSMVVDDRTFARRVYLDIVGMLPSREELHRFLDDRSPDKRRRLVKALLADNTRFAEHWLTFWNDLLRNDYAGTGYIDGGRTQITDWLFDALYMNKPYDRFVSELINPTPESEGFVKGIVWRGVVNASQTPEMQAAQNISQVFMGVNMKCASCHDSFISTWKLADAYGMAAIYSDKALQLVRCDRPTGQMAQIKFMYPQLGQVDPDAPKAKRLEQLASVVTSKQNGRLARTMVNRLWTRLMGRGLVEPNDEMDRRPWNPDLLDWLAADFADHGYDVKRTIELIATSRAYQLPTMGLKSETAEDFVFRGPVVKRMSAEQFVDAISLLTGVWQRPANAIRFVKGAPAFPPRANAEVKFRSGLMKSGSVDIDVDVTGAKALSLVVSDGGNGNSYDWADWAEPTITSPSGEVKVTDMPWVYATTGFGKLLKNKSVVEKPLRLGDKTYTEGIGTHANSIVTVFLPEGATRFRCKAGPDTGAVEQKETQTSIELMVIVSDRSLIESRAALAVADPLMRALGRPNREQVVTQRSAVATTLQALEMTNGSTLAAMLESGAEKWLRAGSSNEIVSALYEQSLSRLPTKTERETALELLGEKATREGVEDLLWALVMLPEFQLVY